MSFDAIVIASAVYQLQTSFVGAVVNHLEGERFYLTFTVVIKCGFVKQVMIKWRCCHAESVVLLLLYSGCYDQHVVSHLFAFIFNLNMI